MTIATHIIKIRGTFDENTWKDEKELKDYVESKIKNEIDSSFHTNLELFKVDGNKIEVWVFVSAFPSEVTRNIIGEWIQDHIKEKGIIVDDFEFKNIVNITEKGFWKNKIFIYIS